jgi:hypothetical protein
MIFCIILFLFSFLPRFVSKTGNLMLESQLATIEKSEVKCKEKVLNFGGTSVFKLGQKSRRLVLFIKFELGTHIV